MDYRTLGVSTGLPPNPEAVAGPQNVEGSSLKPVPRGTSCTCLPRFLHWYMWCNISALTEEDTMSTVTLLINNPPVTQAKINQDACYTDGQF